MVIAIFVVLELLILAPRVFPGHVANEGDGGGKPSELHYGQKPMPSEELTVEPGPTLLISTQLSPESVGESSTLMPQQSSNPVNEGTKIGESTQDTDLSNGYKEGKSSTLIPQQPVNEGTNNGESTQDIDLSINDNKEGKSSTLMPQQAVNKGTNNGESTQDTNLSNDNEEQAITDAPSSSNSVTYSVAELRKRLVCLTALSDNHFKEAKNMFNSVQRCLPDTKIIVYDLGLNQHKQEVKSYTNVELRSFPFGDYVHLPHVKNLQTYAWKPIIVKLVTEEYDVIMYGDSSMRMLSCDISSALEHLINFPYFNCHPRPPERAIEFTHDGMMQYLHYPKNRKDMKDVYVLEANAWLLLANSLMKEKLLEPWLDCALHKECIAPQGAKLLPCRKPVQHDGHYIGCHRYDQSALNMILVREFGMDIAERASNKTLSDLLWSIQRMYWSKSSHSLIISMHVGVSLLIFPFMSTLVSTM